MKLLILLVLILILLSVAFFTLLERKLLSYSQIRLGPNKISYSGIIQPVLDGIKLLKKFNLISMKNHKTLFKLVSLMIFFLSMIMWIIIPFCCWSNKSLMPLFIVLMFGLSSYMMLLLGWSSMNNYSLMGGNRSLAQVLSFEVIITLLILLTFILKCKISLKMFDFKSLMIFLPMSISYMISIIIEAHRAPLDMAEGESELVSGYNTEFSSLNFVMIFLSEYLSLLLMSFLFFMVWFMLSYLPIVFFLMIIIMIRSCYPRIRYDHVMIVIWLKFMPLLIVLWFFYVFM